MKTIQRILARLFIVLLGCSATSHAEDVDIYSGIGGAAGVPNVLMVMDTGANFSASASPPCAAYASGGAPSLGDTGGGVEQCALVDAIESLPLGTVSVGIMVNNGTNFTDGAASGVGPCVGANGGCLVKPLMLMDTAGKTNLIAFIKSWRLSGANSSTQFVIKSGGDRTGSNMQEAWAYYNGKIGLSGKQYGSSILNSGCQKNFIIYIGNSFSNSGGPADTAQSDPDDATVGLASLQVAATAAQKSKLTNTIKFPVTTCGVTELAAGTAASDWSENWADEWARYMNGTDGSADLSGAQNITTYTIGVINNGTHSCKPDYPALLTNMARYGGGKYFQTGDAGEVKNALLKILNEVQAVNSVFSSSSLPVSVNAQGTYLNQIYMGMFRPDASGNPRWVGNLKQYKFIYDAANDSLTMGDSLGVSAISSAGTGFIAPDAVSYWTCGGASTDTKKRSCSPVADPTNGFWVNVPQSAGGAYDLADGELVEKGGVAQIMRLANLTDDYTTTAGTSTNPRKLYTFCPSGASCNALLTDSSNAFATSNSNITASMFGSTSLLVISSIVRTGTSALVTTSSAHGFSTGNSVTISGATQTEYNVTQNVTVNSATTFTITGLPDYPSSPNTGAYTAAIHNSTTKSISPSSNISVTSSTNSDGGLGCTSGTIPNINCNKVTVNLTAHGYINDNTVTIGGVTPAEYAGTVVVKNSTANAFDYYVPITPTSPSANGYTAQLAAPAAKSITNIAKVSGNFVVAATGHGYANGDSVTISGNTISTYNATWTVAAKTTDTFQIAASGNPGTGTGGSATLNPVAVTIAAGNISRTSATATTATATGITASVFSNGQTVYLAKVSGSNTNETAYAPSSGNRAVVITCSGTCTSFTFPITTTPSTTTLTTSSPNVALVGSPVTIAAGQITRTSMGTTATVTGVANAFTTGQSIDIGVSGAAVGSESAYLSPAAGWTITCPPIAGCSTSFTFGPVTLSPATPATGAKITAYQGSTPPAKDPLMNWVRGQDNFGDESGPGGTVTVRPSLHGDVLHSRPVVINYGGTTGVIVYYGSNDGVYRAINGNQNNPTGSSLPAPGSELWGFIPTDFYSKLNRQRINSPELLLPTTPSGIIPTPTAKDYFADGSTGVYQLLNADGTTNTAYLYLAMRRGGRLIYALNVSTPSSPQFLWKIDPAGLTNESGVTAGTSTDFAELGQTWSAPKVALISGYTNPVLIFGAGYDSAEDSEPPAANTMGRGIFIVDAVTGALVWSATPQPTGASACSGSTTKATCLISGMDYSIPADITLVDRDGDGKIDRLYAVDVGGNVWRVDLEPTTAHKTPNYWQVTKLAALGCATGVCASGPPRTTPGKFFYPADVVTTTSFDAVLVGQGDREHPLYSNASYSVTNRFYMVKDLKTGNDARNSDGSDPTLATLPKLFNATSGTYSSGAASTGDATTPNLGYYVTLGSGEKVVNAPLTVAGYTYFGTNQPVAPVANSCSTNLGVARSYKIKPIDATYSSSVYAGGGLPPSPVAGVVSVSVTAADGTVSEKLVPFIIGGGGDSSCTTADCLSALGGGKPPISVSTRRNRTYWYQQMD